MTEFARIIRTMSPSERLLFRAIGWRIPPGTPPAQAQWRKVDAYPWVSEREVKKAKAA